MVLTLTLLCDGPLGVLAANPNDPASGCAVDSTPRGVHVRNFFDGQNGNAIPRAGKGREWNGSGPRCEMQ